MAASDSHSHSRTHSHSIPNNANPHLFNGVVFFLHDTIHPKVRLALHTLLVDSGATPAPASPSRTARFDPSKLTHLVTDTLDFAEYSLVTRHNDPARARESPDNAKGKNRQLAANLGPAFGDDHIGDGKIKIVLPAWVTRSFDLQALQQSRFYSPDPALFLSSTCICTTGLPIADDLTICAAVEAFGGQWRRELTREVTHLIAVAESGKKYDMAIKFGTELGIAIVLPHWFEESLKLNQLVPMDVYRFPSPPYSTSLRDRSVSTKPFVERLTEYWKQRALSSSTTLAGPSTSNEQSPLPPTGGGGRLERGETVATTPTTATHVILGLGEGLARPTSERLRDAETYFRSTHVEGIAASGTLECELDGSTRAGGRGGSGRGGGSRGPGSQRSSSKTARDDNDVGDDQEGGQRRGGGGGSNEAIFAGKKFYLSSDLGLSAGIERAIATKIESFGGRAWSFGLDGDRELEERDPGRRARSASASASATGRDSWARRRIAETRLRDADYVVVRNREGWEYWLAYSLGDHVSIGTPPWLFYQFANHKLTSPLARLVHYPPPSANGVQQFRNKTITVSNYTGLAREYVRTLVELLGAKYEGTMGRGTDYVVTASDIGSKCVHAKSWSIPLVTHLWLEACVTTWSLVDPSLSPAYTVHSSAIEGTMFPTILGWTSWTRDAIRDWAESEERRDEREKGSRSVEELEALERAERETAEDAEMNDDEDPQRVEEAHEFETEDREQPKLAVEGGKVFQSKQKKPLKKEPTEPDERREAPPKPEKAALTGTKEQSAPVARPRTNGDDRSAAMDVDESENRPPSARATSKSRKLTSPPPVEPAPPIRSATPIQVEKQSKPTKPVPGPRVTEDDKHDSSALTDDDDDDDKKTSSSESSLPPSAKQISKHFNQIDAHNLVQPGSKRAAAGKARAALHVAMEDKNQFDQEQKSSARKGLGAGVGAVRRRSSQGRESGSPTKATKKRKIKAEDSSEDEELNDDGKEAGEEDSKPVVPAKKPRRKQQRISNGDDVDQGGVHVEAPRKKVKVANKNLEAAKKEDTTTQEGAVSSFDNPPKAKPAVKSKAIRIITTGLGLDKTSSEIKAMKPLGAVWTEKPQEATHLVVKNLSRTEKFLCCLPFTPFIVTKKWLDACIDAKKLVDETPYLLQDRKKEGELGDTLEAILARARKGKLLDGRKVYITKGVTPDVKAIQRIVSACGGIIAPNNLLKQHKNILADDLALVVSSPKDRREWDKLAQDGVAIYTCEAVFSAAMYQSIERGFTNEHRVDQQLSV